MSGWATSAVSKGAAAAIKPAIDALRKQVGRRGASQIAGQVSLPSAMEFEEALALISEQPGTLPGFLAHHAKRALSDIPDVFQDENVRIWLQREDVRSLVIEGARAAIAGRSADEERQTATASFVENLGDFAWWGEFVFDCAVAFLALTIKTKMNPGQRAIIDNANFNTELLSQEIAGLRASVLPQSPDAIRAFIEPRVRREERERSLVDDQRQDRLVSLARRVIEGDLQAADQDIRIALFRSTAAALARADRCDEAESWIEQARLAGANDLSPDLARVALNRGEYGTVFDLLGDRTDSISVMLVADALKRRDGLQVGLDYIKKHLTAADMSGFALATTATWSANAGDWTGAEKLLAGASPAQCDENPTIPYVRMRLRLALMLPEGQRENLIDSDNALPRQEALRNDVEGRRLSSAAINDLDEFRRLVPDIHAEKGLWFDAQRLFLRLTDRNGPDYAVAVDEIKSLVTEPATAVLFGMIALSFDLDFEWQTLREELARKELFGNLEGAELHAAFQLTMASGTPHEVSAFAERYQDALLAAGAPLQAVVGVRIEIAAKTGRSDLAKELFSEWRQALASDVVTRLEAIIAQVDEKFSAVEAWRGAFKQTGGDLELLRLVEVMIPANDPDLGVSAVELWKRRHRVDDVSRAANALFNAGRDTELDTLLDAIGNDGNHDQGIARHKAWAAFRHGQLADARAQCAVLRETSPDDEGLRQLEINILLESGKWRDLSGIANEDWQRRDFRTARQLLQAAEFSQIIQDPVCDDLARAAVAKAPNDPHILTAAFGFAIRRGTDWSSEAGQWLRNAAKESGPDGPMKKGNIREFIEMAQDRAERTQSLDRMLLSGQMPLELVARPLGITISELILDRLASNSNLRDARQRVCLPLIAGNRLPVDLSELQCVAFDLPALLALEMIGILQAALDLFPKVFLPAGIMPQLFSDYIEAQRGQKSRFEQAQRLKAAIDNGVFVVESGISEPQDDLSEIDWATSHGAHYVHSSPIYKPGSLCEEVMDVGFAQAVIVSPHGLVNALHKAGEIDQDRAEAALSAIRSYGTPWPEEVEVDLSRPLLLDIVALNAMEVVDLIDRIKIARIDARITHQTKRQIENEISQWLSGQAPLMAIEKLRDTLVKSVDEGKAQHGGFNRDKDEPEDDEDAGRSSLMALLTDASGFDALISGDGMINRNAQLTDRKGLSRPIYTIIDVVDHLARTGKIDGRKRNEIRRKLREAGIALVPLEIDEVMEAASQSDWSRGPGVALRAIVTSIHLPTLRKAILLPQEQYWLGNVFSVMTIAIKRCWATLPPETAEDAATWLMKSLPDPHDLLEKGAQPEMALWASNTRLAMHGMLAQPAEVPFERLEEYWNWYDSLVAPQLGGRDRAIVSQIDETLKQNIKSAEAIEGSTEPIPAVVVRQWLFQRLPDQIQQRLLTDASVSEALGFERPTQRVGNHQLELQELVDFISAIFAEKARTLIDVEGAEIASNVTILEDGNLAIEHGGQNIRIDFAGLVSPDFSIREKVLEQILAKRTLAISEIKAWQQTIAVGPLNADQLADFFEVLANAPQAWIRKNRIEDDLTFQDLTSQRSPFYLPFADFEDAESLNDVFEKTVAARGGLPGLRAAIRLFAPLAISPDFKIPEFADKLGDESSLRLVRELRADGDPFSMVAAFQIASIRMADSRFREEADAIFLQLVATNEYCEKIAHDYTACSMLIMGYADTQGALATKPLPLRRAAFLLHAAWAVRVLNAKEVQRPQFLAAVEQWVGATYRLAGLVDRKEGRWWFREWLRPEILAGQIQGRTKGIALSVAEELRPSGWSEHLTISGGAIDLLHMVSGPLDEFSGSWQTNTFPSEEFCNAVAGAKADQAKVILFNTLIAFEMPDEPRQAHEKVLTLLDNAEGEEFATLTNLALMAAARWRDIELADEALKRAMQYGIEEGWSFRLLSEWCVAAAFAGGERPELIGQLEKHLSELLNRDLEPAQASELVGLLDRLIDLIPLAGALRRLRSAALLAT
ncbi:hypothetical protein FHS91_001975 [Sphingobium xanthum]|uniref:HTH domain-containing protein n=1 Tax=Sphingobium xanthum TaxID=1387165 RepID=UPI001C8B9B31|nr:hypothetical protein [Sphingobium xanthum]